MRRRGNLWPGVSSAGGWTKALLRPPTCLSASGSGAVGSVENTIQSIILSLSVTQSLGKLGILGMLTFGRLVGRKIHGCDLPSWRSSYYIQISDYDNNDDNTFDLKYDSNDYENTIRDQGSTALYTA